MDSTRLPFFRIVKHKKIKLKKSIRDQLLSELTLRTTSCLNRCDNYYFSPSQVSLISPLPQFKFKTNQQKFQLFKTQDKQVIKQSVVPQINPKNNRFYKKTKLLLTPFRPKVNQLIDNNIDIDIDDDFQSFNSYRVSPLITNDNNDYDINSNSVDNNQTFSLPFFRRTPNNSSKSSTISSREIHLQNISKYIESSDGFANSSTTTTRTSVNSTIESESQHLKVLPQKTSTPMTQLNQRINELSLSPIIRVNQELGKSFRSLGIQTIASELDETFKTQTIQMFDKTTQTESEIQNISFNINLNSSEYSSHQNNDSDSDPESPFPKKLSQELHKTNY
jgi:hypothetical protein